MSRWATIAPCQVSPNPSVNIATWTNRIEIAAARAASRRAGTGRGSVAAPSPPRSLEQLSFAVCTGPRGVPDLIGHRSNPLSPGAQGDYPPAWERPGTVAGKPITSRPDDREREAPPRPIQIWTCASSRGCRRRCPPAAPMPCSCSGPASTSARRVAGLEVRRRRRADRRYRVRDAADRPLQGAEPADAVGRLRHAAPPTIRFATATGAASGRPCRSGSRTVGRGRGRRPCRARRRRLGRAPRSSRSRRCRPPARGRRAERLARDLHGDLRAGRRSCSAPRSSRSARRPTATGSA